MKFGGISNIAIGLVTRPQILLWLLSNYAQADADVLKRVKMQLLLFSGNMFDTYVLRQKVSQQHVQRLFFFRVTSIDILHPCIPVAA